MRPSAGWALLVLVMTGIAIGFVFRQRHSSPPLEVAALELARGDIPRTPSCFSLGAVLTANRLDGTREWNKPSMIY
jgi:hypothetical protein